MRDILNSITLKLKRYRNRIILFIAFVAFNLCLDFAFDHFVPIECFFNFHRGAFQNFWKAAVAISILFGKYVFAAILFLSYITGQYINGLTDNDGGLPIITIPMLGVIIGILSELVIFIFKKKKS
jgi:hypothetical protein